MLAYDRDGFGIPLVFIHAFPLHRKLWDVQRSFFSKHFQFISMDMPGFGESPVKGEVTSMEDMAKEVISTLNQMGVKEKIVAAGMSMGGYVLFHLWKQFPDRLRALALISTRAEADAPPTREKRFQNIDLIEKEGLGALAEGMLPHLLGNSTRAENPSLVGQVRRWITGGQLKGIQAALRGMADRPDSTPLLSTLHIPTLVVSGAQDTSVTPVEMGPWAKRIPRAEFHVVPKGGHLISLEQPVLFNDLFLAFLKIVFNPPKGSHYF